MKHSILTMAGALLLSGILAITYVSQASAKEPNKIEKAAKAKGIKLPPLPWHLADIWWSFPQKTEHLERLDIDVTLDRDVPDDVNLYVAPIGLADLNNIKCYGGLQTRIGGWPDKKSRRMLRPGKGGIFSRWSQNTEEPIGLDHVDMPQGALCESNGYEGEFCSVRRPYAWKAGTYTFSLIKENTIVFKNIPHTWFSLNITDQSNQSTFKIGRLLFEGSDFTFWNRHSAFVEIYGMASDIPELKITFGMPRVNGKKMFCEKGIAVRNPEGISGAPNCAVVTLKDDKVVIDIAPVIQEKEFTRIPLYFNKK